MFRGTGLISLRELENYITLAKLLRYLPSSPAIGCFDFNSDSCQ